MPQGTAGGRTLAASADLTSSAAGAPALLQVTNLTVRYDGTSEPAVRSASFEMRERERVGLVGESGSGKSTLALAISRLLPGTAEVSGGTVQFRGTDIGLLSEEEMRKLRGGKIGRVPQDSLAGLNPVITVGHQLRDAVRAHRKPPRLEERSEIIDLLRAMNMPDIELKLRSYPHELSGGMRQRALIAMALINRPALLVADEPTTALDATVQAQLLEVFRDITGTRGSALLLVSHDINVVAAVCQRIIVMYRGEIVEDGPASEVIASPAHPYTEALVAARSTRAVATHVIPTLQASDHSPKGCQYAPRCGLKVEACAAHPQLQEIGERRVRCFVRTGL